MRHRPGIFFIFTLGFAAVAQLGAQTVATAKPPAASDGSQPATAVACAADDRFASLRCVADQFRAAYDKVDDQNMSDIETLMKDKRCTINRVDGLLSRARDAMNLWFDAEKKYWNETEIAENSRREGQEKALTAMVQDQATAQQLLDSLTQDKEKLLRDKAELEKAPKRTQEIQKAIDELILDIQGDESRIADAQKHFEDATLTVNNTKIALDARLIEVRQYQRRLDVFREQREAYYQTTRAAADAVCSVPGNKNTKALPTPKGAQ